MVVLTRFVTVLIADTLAAIRTLAAARSFTAIAWLTLAGGLTLTAVILSVVNAYVLRSLPYPAADRLYRVDYAPPGQPTPRGMEQLDWSSLGDVIELPIAWDLDVFYLLGHDYPESAPGAWVTPGFVNALGIRASLGRSLVPADYALDSPAVALISHRLWQSRFGADTAVVGRTFNAYVSDRPDEPETLTIVGVLPADFWHVNVYTEVIAPLKAPSYPYQVRLHTGVPPAVAAERIDRLIRNGVPSLPMQYGVTLTALQDSYVAQMTPMLWSVGAGAVLVLLIAAANVGVLTIVRARQRQRELAVRVALGASLMHLVRLLALEGVLLGIVSTLSAVAATTMILPAIAPLIQGSLERRIPGGLGALSVDRTVILMLIVCAVITTMLIAWLPVVSSRRSRRTAGAVWSARGLTDDVGTGRARALLIGIEIAASLTLLVGASLMVESAVRMLRVDFGIAETNVVTASLALRQRSFPEESDRAAFYARLQGELRAVAGTPAVAFGDWWPLQGSRPRRAVGSGSAARETTVNPFAVSPAYFQTVGIRMRDGREFTDDDRLGSPPVVIVSASLASQLWPETPAIGQHLTIYADGEGPPLTAAVVGVASDVRQSHADMHLLDAYLPLAQRPSRFAFVYLRAPQHASWEADLRGTIARVNPEVAMGTPRPLGDGLEQERARPRLLAYLLTAFAVFACALALIGMHGVIAYATRQRQREIAVRIAVGASARAVAAMFVKHAVFVLSVGLAGGLAGAIALGRVLQSQLYGVRPTEPRVLGTAAAVLGAFALAAVIRPAWRAASTDPAEALRQE
jgi:putative ABC transport system permease protein